MSVQPTYSGCGFQPDRHDPFNPKTTEVEAFESDKKTADAWVPIDDLASLFESEYSNVASYQFVDFGAIAKSEPGLEVAVIDAGFSTNPILSFNAPSEAKNLKFENISATYVRPGASITVSSDAAFDTKNYYVTTEIKIDGSKKSDIRVKSPYLLAIDEAEAAIHLIQLMSEYKNSYLPANYTGNDFMRYYAPYYDGSLHYTQFSSQF